MVLWQRILQNEERSLIGTPCTERQAIDTISKTNLDNLQNKLAKKLAKRDHMVVSAKNRIIEVLLCFCPGARAFFTILTLP